jgi:hypothetical protein
MYGAGSSSLGSTGGPYTMSQMLRSSASSRLAVRSRLWHRESTCGGSSGATHVEHSTGQIEKRKQSAVVRPCQSTD